MKHHLRIIGDVHGHKERYLRLTEKAECSIQLGDMAFDYDFLRSTDPNKHKFFGGNHDNYDKIDVSHHLGNHGIHTIPNFGDIFFVRGAYSIDWHLRTEGLDWWRQEELNHQEAGMAMDAYREAKPKFVITHGCPYSITGDVTSSAWIKRTRTGSLLQAMLEEHQPETWVFGHYHKSWSAKIGRTKFICLDELECLDFSKTGEET